MTVSDNTIQEETLRFVSKNLGKKGPNVSKKILKDISKNPGQALDITANIVTAAASINPKNKMSTLLELGTFYSTGKWLYLGKFV